jgi:hypothetical protein
VSRSDCLECDRVARYMAADPEMYRGDRRECSTHRELRELREAKAAPTHPPQVEEIVDRLRTWYDAIQNGEGVTAAEVKSAINWISSRLPSTPAGSADDGWRERRLEGFIRDLVLLKDSPKSLAAALDNALAYLAATRRLTPASEKGES